MGINHFFGGLQNLSEVYNLMLQENRVMSYFTVPFLVSVAAALRIIEDGELSKRELQDCGDNKAKMILAGVPDITDLISKFTILSRNDGAISSGPK